MESISCNEVIQKEQEHLRLRRQKLGFEHGTAEKPNWFGIAMSGGGIRSATINLGILKTLNKYGVLQKADYLSTVSGRRFYPRLCARNSQRNGRFGKLFARITSRNAQKHHGEYWVPHTGLLGQKQARPDSAHHILYSQLADEPGQPDYCIWHCLLPLPYRGELPLGENPFTSLNFLAEKA